MQVHTDLVYINKYLYFLDLVHCSKVGNGIAQCKIKNDIAFTKRSNYLLFGKKYFVSFFLRPYLGDRILKTVAKK